MYKFNDLANKTFGQLKVLGRSNISKKRYVSQHIRWNCLCSCGNIVIVSSNSLLRGQQTCSDRVHFMEDMTEQKFGKLTVLNYVISEDNQTRWKCLCECGSERVVSRRNLLNNSTKACEKCAAGNRRIEYGEANFNSLYSNYKRGAKEREYEFSLTKEQFRKLTKSDCYYCNVEPKQLKRSAKSNGPYIYNGVDRKNNDFGYTVKNCVPCCRKCNIAKNNMGYEEFIEWIKRVFDNVC